ncbi:MAG: CPBP family intramembrane metalloprotease, partial [Chthoniobacteraceae bacterium]|nr:CPBP family intramembrane metalloprotease [Chthoniobacteraceae bacterium]
KVWDAPLALPDLLVVASLAAWMGSNVFFAWKQGFQHHALSDEKVVGSAVLFALINGAIVLFLRSRGISVARLFGLRPARPLAALGTGAGLFLAALPLIWAVSALVQRWGGETQTQEIVRYFVLAVEQRDWGRILLAAGFATTAAPLLEEFLFRGYFYGTLRRHLGAPAALLLVSALFASIHLNAAALAPLFVLAACLTLAYEATGSLWTSICMHALFNTLMLGAMAYRITHGL